MSLEALRSNFGSWLIDRHRNDLRQLQPPALAAFTAAVRATASADVPGCEALGRRDKEVTTEAPYNQSQGLTPLRSYSTPNGPPKENRDADRTDTAALAGSHTSLPGR